MKKTLFNLISFFITIFIVGCFNNSSDDKTIQQEQRLTAKAIESSGIWGANTEAGLLFNEDKSVVILAANEVTTKRLYPGMRHKLYFQDLELKEINNQLYLMGPATIVNLYDNSETNSFIALEMHTDNDGNIILGTITNECIGDPCSQCEWTGEKCKCKDYTSTNKCNHRLIVVEESSD